MSCVWMLQRGHSGDGCVFACKKKNITVNRSIEALWCEIIIDDKKNDKVIYKNQWGIKDCIVMGDFNRQGINWETLVTDGHGEKLLDLSQNLFQKQHVLENKRINIGSRIQL